METGNDLMLVFKLSSASRFILISSKKRPIFIQLRKTANIYLTNFIGRVYVRVFNSQRIKRSLIIN